MRMAICGSERTAHWMIPSVEGAVLSWKGCFWSWRDRGGDVAALRTPLRRGTEVVAAMSASPPCLSSSPTDPLRYPQRREYGRQQRHRPGEFGRGVRETESGT